MTEKILGISLFLDWNPTNIEKNDIVQSCLQITETIINAEHEECENYMNTNQQDVLNKKFNSYIEYMGLNARKPFFDGLRTTKGQTSLRIRAV